MLDWRKHGLSFEEGMAKAMYEAMVLERHEQRFKLIWRDLCKLYHDEEWSYCIKETGYYDSIMWGLWKTNCHRTYTRGELKFTLNEAQSRGWVEDHLCGGRKLYC